MPRILFVSGFHPATRARDLAYEFERFGQLVRCDVPAPRNPHASHNPYAFVEFRSTRDAEDAYYDMHGRYFEGSRLSIQWAKNPPSSVWRYDRRTPLLLIAPAGTVNALAALAAALREKTATGTGMETGTIVTGEGVAVRRRGREAHPPIAGETIGTATAQRPLLQSKKLRKRMIEKKTGLEPRPMIIESLFFHFMFPFLAIFLIQRN
ncbi:hypothetical protein BDZ97DRAFT_2072801 [Flammula alnicola]|nr:hypothetical protein BDZ97DRAFT_2072801 [Flammula alnicola]